MPVVRLRAHRNGSLRGLHWQHKTQDKNRLLSSTHRSIRLQFARRMGAQTDTLQWRHIYCSLYIYYGASDRSGNFGTRSRSSYERACWIGDFRFVLVFVFSGWYTKLKKQYSTANTVLLLPLTTKNSTVLLLPNQHKNKQQYNSTTIHDLNLQQ